MRVMLVILVAETKLRFSQLFACEGVVFTKVLTQQPPPQQPQTQQPPSQQPLTPQPTSLPEFSESYRLASSMLLSLDDTEASQDHEMDHLHMSSREEVFSHPLYSTPSSFAGARSSGREGFERQVLHSLAKVEVQLAANIKEIELLRRKTSLMRMEMGRQQHPAQEDMLEGVILPLNNPGNLPYWQILCKRSGPESHVPCPLSQRGHWLKLGRLFGLEKLNWPNQAPIPEPPNMQHHYQYLMTLLDTGICPNYITSFTQKLTPGAVLKRPASAVDHHDVEQQIKIWLRGSADRKGGRKRGK
ncbi:hypothetical protein CAPTEDRAFT_210096 [Capitella teleta]|uniref:Uncharacterized protein n=1 Tax=Capitella teleta TaxID=283909 RepID=R7VG06_CAPTE|nr:hypothetical protein CAPTEDRAFT_210096 [Capitella teleta]|eukprot:ELU17773.1 hypothetical protein CAPTEDRAFT_210096 [Capitella teleta]